jgi:two-component system response regulator PilR (NtrC family)
MPEPKSQKRKILVVEDEPQVRDVLKMLLSFDGHEVVTAGDADEALAAFEREPFDLVLTDYHMPGMKGDELALALKARLPGQPVVMVTAYAEMLKASTAPLRGVDQLVNKPFQIQELRDAIHKATTPPV